MNRRLLERWLRTNHHGSSRQACVRQGQFLFSAHQSAGVDFSQRVYDIIHPERRNLTAIRGYKRLGGVADDPANDPQDRVWYGPHDRLFSEEESVEVSFQPGPKHGTLPRSRVLRC